MEHEWIDGHALAAEEAREIIGELSAALAVLAGERLELCVAPCPGHLGPKANEAFRAALKAWDALRDGNLRAEARAAARIAELEEREAAIRKQLRIECQDLGDNDWPDDLHLADVIDKHLARPAAARIVELEAKVKALELSETALVAERWQDRAEEAGEQLVEAAARIGELEQELTEWKDLAVSERNRANGVEKATERRLSRLDALLASEEPPEGLVDAIDGYDSSPNAEAAWRWFRETLGADRLERHEEAIREGLTASAEVEWREVAEKILAEVGESAPTAAERFIYGTPIGPGPSLDVEIELKGAEPPPAVVERAQAVAGSEEASVSIFTPLTEEAAALAAEARALGDSLRTGGVCVRREPVDRDRRPLGGLSVWLGSDETPPGLVDACGAYGSAQRLSLLRLAWRWVREQAHAHPPT